MTQLTMSRGTRVALASGVAVTMSLTLGQAPAAHAQVSPPLPQYVPPPSATPLAPLPGAIGAASSAPENLGEVRATSSTPANIAPGDTRSVIAPALPAPEAGNDTMRAYLYAAQRALQFMETGAAQEALERAESRALDRSVDPSAADVPSRNDVVQAIQTARQALGEGKLDVARAAISKALAGG